MKKFFSAVVKHRIFVLVIFIIAFAVCLVLRNMVAVDYDINNYLPEDSASTVAIDVMENEFEGGIPNVRVMISDVTIPRALEYKQNLKKIELA